MKSAKLLSIILYLSLIFLVDSATNYFQGLTINQTLLDNANNAIADLKLTLEQNFDCKDKDDDDHRERQQSKDRQYNLRGHRLLLQSKKKSFRKFKDREQYEYSQSSFKSSWGFTSKYQIGSGLYKKVSKVAQLLEQVKKYLIQYNNVIIGNNNALNGSGNVIIGNRDNLTGNNNWVFASDFQSTNPENGVLIIEVYLIQLDQLFELITNPKGVIRCLHRQESQHRFQSWWNGADWHHRMRF